MPFARNLSRRAAVFLQTYCEPSGSVSLAVLPSLKVTTEGPIQISSRDAQCPWNAVAGITADELFIPVTSAGSLNYSHFPSDY